MVTMSPNDYKEWLEKQSLSTIEFEPSTTTPSDAVDINLAFLTVLNHNRTAML